MWSKLRWSFIIFFCVCCYTMAPLIYFSNKSLNKRTFPENYRTSTRWFFVRVTASFEYMDGGRTLKTWWWFCCILYIFYISFKLLLYSVQWATYNSQLPLVQETRRKKNRRKVDRKYITQRIRCRKLMA